MSTPFAVALLAAGLAAQSTAPQAPKSPRPPALGEAKTEAGPMAPKDTAREVPEAWMRTHTSTAAPEKPGDAAAPHAIAAAAAAFSAKDLLLIDTPREGEHWVRGANYKAGFDHDGIGFFAAPASVTEAAPSVSLHPSTASVGGVSLRFGSPAPQRHDRRFSWDRGPFVETVDVRPDSIEQSFVFATLPNRGELVLELAVTGSAPGADRGDGFVLAGGAITGTEAVAIDAHGERIPAPTVLDGDRLTIRVPAEFVARAALPLVVDPIFATTVAASSSVTLDHPDLVWDRTGNCWTVVYESHYALNDTDLYAQRMDAACQPIGGPFAIDITTNCWVMPSIANLDAHSRNLVVAQVSVDDPAPYWVGGRVLSGAGAVLTGQLDIEKAGLTGHAVGDKVYPRVGGDPNASLPVYWTVVWERVFSTSDHDIHLKQVQFDGTLRAAAPTLVANDSWMDTFPTISKSDGPSPATKQRWLLAWQRLAGTNDHDIYGSLVEWDGGLVDVGGVTKFGISTMLADETFPAVSTETDGTGTRWFLCVHERAQAPNGGLIASLVTDAGYAYQGVDLATLSPAPSLAWHPGNAQVDCDGQRFTVAYQAQYGGSGGDLDTWSLLVGHQSGSVSASDPAWVSGTAADEFSPAVASVYSSTGQRCQALAFADELIGPSRREIGMRGYQAFAQGQFTTRSTSCGQLSIQPSGIVGIGQTANFSLGATHPLTGFVVGFPTNNWTPVCPSCTLGVDGTSLLGQSYSITVPNDVGFIGATLSVQGWTFAGGPCLGTVSVSNTIDMLLP